MNTHTCKSTPTSHLAKEVTGTKNQLCVFLTEAQSLEKHNASEMEGTTLKALPRERRTMSSAQLIQNILLIQRILGEYREGFLYF